VRVLLDGLIFYTGSPSTGMSLILSSASVFGFYVIFLVPLVPMVPATVLDL
jgi:hypothetical protein